MAELFLALFVFTASVVPSFAATLTVQTNVIGVTPNILAYNLGHYYPGSNTRDWFRYAGVNGMRVFISPTYIEPSDALPPWGDGVTDQTSFQNRKALLRSDPLNTNYINWSYITNRYGTSGQLGNNILQPNYALAASRQLAEQILVDSTATASKFTNMTAWPDRWELWHFYYEQAFYLGKAFDVQRYQMYNEPNATSLTQTDYVARLQLASDAIQCAVADVNTMYGKSLVPTMFAPVLAGNATNHFFDWGVPVLTNRHVNYLGQSNTSISLLQVYDYHEYGGGGAPSSFGTHLLGLKSDVTSAMSPETPYPISISEYNVYDGSVFNGLTTTLDTPTNYSAFGGITVNLIKDLATEIYCFKFSQTFSTYIAKNGMHYVDNNIAPYNTGGITKAGEVWRLINKGFASGRNRLNFSADSGAAGLDVQASYDPITKRYYLLSVNNTVSTLSLNANLAALGIPTNNQVLVEEVSENIYGAGTIWTNLGASQTVSGTQGANTVWLYTVPSRPQQPMQTIVASEDATVSDGTNKNTTFGAGTNLLVVNNSTNANQRNAALIKFQLPAVTLSNLQFAVLSVRVATINGASGVSAHIYGITNNNWSQNGVTWATAPNLMQSVSSGTNYANNFMVGVGDLTNSANAAGSAQIVGQLVAGPAQAERFIDVTDFIKNTSSTNVSFLVSRGVRFPGDTLDGDGISIVSTEGNPALAPRLELVMNQSTLVITNPVITLKVNAAATNSVFQATFSPYQTGLNYQLQSATNLISPAWTNLPNLTVTPTNSQGFIIFTNTAASAAFYRLSVSPTP